MTTRAEEIHLANSAHGPQGQASSNRVVTENNGVETAKHFIAVTKFAEERFALLQHVDDFKAYEIIFIGAEHIRHLQQNRCDQESKREIIKQLLATNNSLWKTEERYIRVVWLLECLGIVIREYLAELFKAS